MEKLRQNTNVETPAKVGAQATTVATRALGEMSRILCNTFACEHRLYTHVYECEQQLADLYRESRLKLQAEDVDIDEMSDSESEDDTANMLAQVGRAVESMKGCVSDDKKWLAETLESFVQIVYWFRKCESTSDYIMHITMGYKLLTGGTLGRCVETAILPCSVLSSYKSITSDKVLIEDIKCAYLGELSTDGLPARITNSIKVKGFKGASSYFQTTMSSKILED